MRLNNARVITPVVLTAALPALFVLLHQTSGLARDDKPPARSAASTASASPASTPSNDNELARAIDRSLSDTEMKQARFGVFVISGRDGRVLYAHNSDQLFTPASNMKVYT